MWIDEASADHFQHEVDRHGSIILEGVPVPAERYITRDGDHHTNLAVVRMADGRYAVLVPEDLTPRTAGALAAMDETALNDSGWRTLRLESSGSVAAVLAEAGRVLGIGGTGLADTDAQEPGSFAQDDDSEAEESETESPVPFTQDLTALAKCGDLPTVYGRERELEETYIILLQQVRNCPLLVGEPGVGKTAVVEKMAHVTANGDLPAPLRELRILALDLPELVAASRVHGELEQSVRDLLSALRADQDLLLFVDEFHNLTDVRGDLSLIEVLKPEMARGLRLMGATTQSDYKQKISPDQALVRRMDIVRIEEPSSDETVDILMARLPELQGHHAVEVDRSQVEEIVRLADEYMPDRRRPDSALTLLDRSMAAQVYEGAR